MGTELAKKRKLKEKKQEKKHSRSDLKNDEQLKKIEEVTDDQVNLGQRKKKKKTVMKKGVEGSVVVESNHSQISVKADSNKQAKLKKDKLKKKRKIVEDNDVVTAEQLGTEAEDCVVEQSANLNEKTEDNKKNKLRKKRKMKGKTNSLADHSAGKNSEEGITDAVTTDQLGTEAEDGVEGQNANLNKKTKESKKSKLRKKRKMEGKTDSLSDHQASNNTEEGKSMNAKKRKKKDLGSSKEKFEETTAEGDADEVLYISSGDEDCTRGMKKWVTDYYNNRPGLNILQERIDDFITAHEERLEQERQEREAKAAEGGWTVVVHHKGRKKTTDSESGITVGSVAQAAVEDKMSKKKHKEVVAQDFYRFQKREAHRNEIMTLQSKFEQDRKRIQELRAARKFKPY